MVRKNKQEITVMIISIIAAFALWLYVMGEKNPDQNMTIANVPVQLINTDSVEQSNFALLPDQHFTVNLTVRGKLLDVINVSADNFRLVADMSSAVLKKGDNNTIHVEVREAPNGVEVQDKDAYYIKVKLDSLTEKSIPVAIKITGDTKAGFNYLQPVPRPSEVLVSGPTTYVNSVISAVGTIDISNASENVTGSIAVKALDMDNSPISYVKVEPKYVDVTIPVKPAKEVPIVIRTTGTLKNGKIIKSTKPSVDSVIVIGDSKYLDQIKQIETVPFDISNLTMTSSKELLLDVPSNVGIFSNLKSINVNFVVENIIEKTIDVSINYMNQNDQYNYSFSNNSLSLTLSGPESAINSDKINDISASLDLGSFVEGTHELAPKISLTDGIELKSSSPDKVTVTITKK